MGLGRLNHEINTTLTTAAVMLLLRALLAGTPVYAETPRIQTETDDGHRLVLVHEDTEQTPTDEGVTDQEVDRLEGIRMVPIEARYYYAPGQFVDIHLELGLHEKLNTDTPLIHVGQWGVPDSQWHFASNGSYLELISTADDGSTTTYKGEAHKDSPAEISDVITFRDSPEDPRAASVRVITDGDRVTGVSTEVNGQPLEVTGHVFFGENPQTGEEWYAIQNMGGDWEFQSSKPGYVLRVGIGQLVEQEGQEPQLLMPTQWIKANSDGIAQLHVPGEQAYIVFSLTPQN